MTNAEFALQVSLIARISAQWSHELVYGMWNPDFCAAEARGPTNAPARFIEEIEIRLGRIREGMDKATEPRP